MSGDFDSRLDASRMPTAQKAASEPCAAHAASRPSARADCTSALDRYESVGSTGRYEPFEPAGSTGRYEPLELAGSTERCEPPESAGSDPAPGSAEFGRELVLARFPGASWFESEACARLDHPIEPELTSFLDGDELFFDVETLGFHGRQLFLVGTILREGSHWWIRQLLARDYTEEEGVLADFAELAATRSMWISFNGKAFDAPFLRTRAAFYRLRLPEPEVHLDLLHGARRVYRKLLPDCRLQTLEARIFGRYRVRDLPGREVPSAYHEYVRTGRADDLIRILRHNRDDLQSLVRLHRHLLEP